jgi:2-polyprenyl-6-methoxyphenol hydroxylase-like FAD-dependent oxidoreductase
MVAAIAIVGGGPGGLALAKLLAVHGIESTVLELDADPTARGQGGSLDLHADSGLRALELAGLRAAFDRVARYEDQDIYMYDPAGALLYEEAGLGGGRPEVDRGELRKLLIESLPAGTIEWGKRVTGVESLGDGRTRVRFDNEPAREFELVVGADGAWSRVRPLVSDVRPAYTGVSFVEVELDKFDARHPDLVDLVPHGKLMALGEHKALIAQRNARSNMRVYVALAVPESGARELATRSPSEIKAELLRQLAGWSPRLRALIERADDRALVLPICALPIGHSWTHRRGATLLGDAAHVMSPFGGEGVNNAMRDAVELALGLAARTDDRDAAVARYEADMFARVVESAQDSAVGLDVAMSDDAAARMVEIVRSHRPPEPAG